MMVVGITGGIGSGKSIVCEVFSRMGVPVYEADKAVHHLYEKYPDMIERVRKEVSEEAVDKNGKIIRKKLSEIAFADKKKLDILNSIVHPMVKFDFDEWKKKNKSFPYVIKEAAILFESGAFSDCNKVITVIAPLELRISRVRERDHKSRAEIVQIISRQLNDEEKIKRSDFVIHNDEKQMILPQVIKLHGEFNKI